MLWMLWSVLLWPVGCRYTEPGRNSCGKPCCISFVICSCICSLPLHHCSWHPGVQYKRYKDCLNFTLNRCGIAPSELEALAMGRAYWCSSCKTAVEKFETWCIQELESKRDLRKSGQPPTSNFECQNCHRMCRSWIGLFAHNKSHSWWWDPSRWRLSPWNMRCTPCFSKRTTRVVFFCIS